MDALQHFSIILGTFFLAGIVRGIIGLGLPTVAVGLLGLVMAPMEAAAILIVPSLVTNVWQLAAGPNLKKIVRRLWLMLIGICIGTALGAWILSGFDLRHASAALGAALVLYALVGLASLRLSVSAGVDAWLSPLIGAATGVTTAATGVFVIPAVPYLQALDLNKEDMVQAMGRAFTVSTVALAMTLLKDPAFRPAVAGASFVALPPALAGMFLGQWIRTRVSAATFRRCFFCRPDRTGRPSGAALNWIRMKNDAVRPSVFNRRRHGLPTPAPATMCAVFHSWCACDIANNLICTNSIYWI